MNRFSHTVKSRKLFFLTCYLSDLLPDTSFKTSHPAHSHVFKLNLTFRFSFVIYLLLRMKISLTQKNNQRDHLVILAEKETDWKLLEQPEENIDIIRSQIKKDINQIVIPSPSRMIFIVILEKKELKFQQDEGNRKEGFKTLSLLNKHKVSSVVIQNFSSSTDACILFAEGMALGNYQFLFYKKAAVKEQHALKEIRILDGAISKTEILTLQSIIDSVYMVRNLVNMPVNYLNATDLANEIVKAGKMAGFKTQVFNKNKITALKMGGLLSVNQGSVDPPTFTIMEYAPKNALNKKPIIFIL